VVFHGKRKKANEKEATFSIVVFQYIKPPAGQYERVGELYGSYIKRWVWAQVGSNATPGKPGTFFLVLFQRAHEQAVI